MKFAGVGAGKSLIRHKRWATIESEQFAGDKTERRIPALPSEIEGGEH